MRLPYTDNPPTNLSSDDEEILKRVQARRGEKGLIALDLALLHAPKVADGWNSHLGAIRTRSSLPDDIREIAILRPALIGKAWFEWSAHLPILQASSRFPKSDSALGTISTLHPTEQGELTSAQWVVLRFADAMTRSVEVSDDLFAELRAVEKDGEGSGKFSEREIVEITATVATYNMVSRFLVALDIGERNGKVPDTVTGGGNA